ncbi:MAG: hypothetical protein AMXMBFR8_30770 [Nevskiales bacterium]
MMNPEPSPVMGRAGGAGRPRKNGANGELSIGSSKRPRADVRISCLTVMFTTAGPNRSTSVLKSGRPATTGGEEAGAGAEVVADGSGGVAAMAGECHAVGRKMAEPATAATTTPEITNDLVFMLRVPLTVDSHHASRWMVTLVNVA